MSLPWTATIGVVLLVCVYAVPIIWYVAVRRDNTLQGNLWLAAFILLPVVAPLMFGLMRPFRSDGGNLRGGQRNSSSI